MAFNVQDALDRRIEAEVNLNNIADKNSQLYKDQLAVFKELSKLLDGKTNKAIEKMYATQSKYKDLLDVCVSLQNDLNAANQQGYQGNARINDMIRARIAYQQESVELQREEVKNTKKVADNISLAKKLYQDFLGGIKASWDMWKKMDDIAYKHGRTIGFSADEFSKYRENIINQDRRITQMYGVEAKYIENIRQSLSKATQAGKVMGDEVAQSLVAVSKSLGEDTTKNILEAIDDIGGSAQRAAGASAQMLARARNNGLDLTKAGENLTKALKMSQKYAFKEGVNGMTKMVAKAQSLKMSMESISSAADKFYSIEGAIQTGAKLQVLGGSIASTFGNSMQMFALAHTDMEAFTDKMTDTFKNLSIFDKKTGQAHMSDIDTQRARLAAEALGMNPDEFVASAKRAAVREAAEREYNRSDAAKNVTDPQLKEFFLNQQQFDAETKKFYIESADGQKLYLDRLTNARLADFKNRMTTEDAIQDDVHKILMLLDKEKQYAQDATSFSEQMIGTKDSAKLFGAKVFDLTRIGDFLKEGAKYLFAPLALAAASVGSGLYGRMTNAGGNMINRIFGSSKFDPTKPSPSTGKFEFKKFAKKGGKWATIAGALALGGLLLSNSASASEPQALSQADINGLNPSTSGGSVEDELAHQTQLLQEISNKMGTSSSYGGASGSFSSGYVGSSYENRSVFGKYGNGAAAAETISDMAVNSIGSYKLEQKMLSKLLKKGVKGGGVGIGIDLANMGGQMLGLWGEGSGMDKTLSIGSSIAFGASVGGPVGAVVGAIYGVADQFGEDLNNKANEMLNSNGIMNTVGGAALKAVASNLNAVKDAFNTIGDAASDVVGGLWDGAKSIVSGDFEGGISAIGDGLWSAAKDTWRGIGNVMYDIVDGVTFGGLEHHSEEERAQMVAKANAKLDKELFETSKIGVTSITDPQLMGKAALATIKIHEQLTSYFNEMNGLDADGYTQEEILKRREEANKAGEDGWLRKTWDSVSGFFGGMFATGGIVKNGRNNLRASNGDSTLIAAKEGEMVLTKEQQGRLFSIVNGDVTSLPTVGTSVFISPNASNGVSNGTSVENINVNISGTLRLTSDRGSVGEIDMKQLLNNHEFMDMIFKHVTSQMDRKGQMGVAVNKNSSFSRRGYGIESNNW